MLLPFSEYLPDQPDYENPGTSVALNVVPRTPQSYGPFPSLAAGALNALDARCQGAIGVRDSASNSYNFAGTVDKLYEATGGTTWTDVSQSGGYAVAAIERWNFAQFSDTLLAFQINNNIQSFVLNSSTAFADLSASAPKCRYGCVARDFFLALNTSDSTNGPRPQRVWWPAIGDVTNWPALGSTSAAAVQSDAQDILGDQGWGTGIVANVGPADAVIFFERGVWRAMYIGAPDIWGFYPANGVRGCPIPGSIKRTELGIIYLGPDDFYLYDGNNPVGIGFQKVAKTFYADVDQANLDRISSALDPINKLYYLAYPSLSTGNGVVDTILVCNYGLASGTQSPGRWAKIKDSSIMGELLFISTSFGYNVDNFTSLTGFTVDSAPAGPDSRLWTGNKDLLTFFDTTHTLKYFTGSNLAASIQTSEKQLLKGRRAHAQMARPVVDGGTAVVTPFTRSRVQDTPVARTPATIDTQGYAWLKDAEGFFHRFQVDLAAGASFTHASGVEVIEDSLLETGFR